MNGNYQVGSGRIVAVTHDTPFITNSILDSSEKINPKEENGGIFVCSYSAERTEEFSTRQTLHAAVNTRKGANGELFIDSIPDSGEKSKPSEENSSQEVGEAQFSLAKSEDGKAHPYTKRGADAAAAAALTELRFVK